MTVVHVLFAVLAAWRLTEIITQDVIFEGVRKWWVMRFQGKRYANFLSCSRCVSVWTGIISTLLFIFAPFVSWPLAISTLYLTNTAIISRIMRVNASGNGHRQIVIYPDQQRMELGPFDVRSSVQIMKQIVTFMESRSSEPNPIMFSGNGNNGDLG